MHAFVRSFIPFFPLMAIWVSLFCPCTMNLPAKKDDSQILMFKINWSPQIDSVVFWESLDNQLAKNIKLWFAGSADFPGINTVVADFKHNVMSLKVDQGRSVYNGPQESYESCEPAANVRHPNLYPAADFFSFFLFCWFLYLFLLSFLSLVWSLKLFCSSNLISYLWSFGFVVCDVLFPALGPLLSPSQLLIWHVTFKRFGQGHTTNKWQSWDLNPGLF